MAWLTGWSRRKQLYLNGTTAGAQSAYQLKITVNYGSGTDTSGNIFCGGNVRTDFGDIRFTDTNGTNLLYYWIESYTASSSAVVWIKIPSIPTGSNSTYIYFYYNNPSSTTTSDGPNTFEFFNNGNNITGWTTTGTLSWTIVSGMIKGTGSSNGVLYSPYTISNGIIEAKVIINDSGINNEIAEIIGRNPMSNLGGYSNCIYKDSSTIKTNKIQRTHLATLTSQSWDFNYGQSYKLTMILYGTSIITYVNDSLQLSVTDSNYTSGRVAIGGNELGSAGAFFSDVRVRKYVSPEPIWSSTISSEQVVSLTINSTPSGARIWLAHPTGTTYIDQGVNTNTTISNLESGTYDIKLVLSGYSDWILINQNYTTNQTISATLTAICGTPACNLIVLSILSEQLLEKPPGYLDLDKLSIYIDYIINNYIAL